MPSLERKMMFLHVGWDKMAFKTAKGPHAPGAKMKITNHKLEKGHLASSMVVTGSGSLIRSRAHVPELYLSKYVSATGLSEH